jgi:cytochrome P450
VAIDDSDLKPFRADPLALLAEARRQRGPVFPLHMGGAVFSRLADCRAVAAVFGADAVKQVLSDSDAFALPASAAAALALPARLAGLNRSLHSMAEPEHGQHKRALGALLGSQREEQASSLQQTLDRITQSWPRHEPQPLLSRMRELSLGLAQCVLLSPRADPALAPLLHQYFLLRREAAAPAAAAGQSLRAPLLATGRRLDQLLRRHLRSPVGGLLGRLHNPQALGGLALSEDEAVGHANILFVSATEPVAVALTWVLLLLSQRPALRRALRDDPALLDPLLLESLRLLPPNGFMVRVTTRAVQLAGLSLPAHSEVILCPLLSQREPAVFDRPERFLPQRWRAARPTPFEYFPFGAGGHACVGRSLAMDTMRSALAFMAQRFDTVLHVDQAIDWRLHVMFMPRAEITVRFVPPGAPGATGENGGGGQWTGPVAGLVELQEEGDACLDSAVTHASNRSA